MSNRDKLIKSILDHYNVDYNTISLGVYTYAIRYIMKYAQHNEDDKQYYFNFSVKNDRILGKRKKTIDSNKNYRTIILDELQRCRMIKLHRKSMFGVNNTTYMDNKHMAEEYRLNKSVYAYISDLTNKQKSLVIGIDENFKIIDEELLKKINEDMAELSKKTRLEMENELCETLKHTEIVIPKEKKAMYFNLIDAPKIGWYNYETPDTTVSSKTGRIFHPMANLRKVYRQYMTLKVNGRKFPLKCIDLKSSQPLLLTTMTKCEKYKDIVINNDIYDWLVDKAKDTVYVSSNGKKRNLTSVIKLEEFLYKKIGRKYVSPLTREGMKVQFMRFVGSNRRLPIIDAILEQHLPEFYTEIVAQKKELNEGNYLKDEEGEYIRKALEVKKKDGTTYVKNIKVYKDRCDKNYITTVLQQIESDIFISVWEDYSDMTIPLHDCLYFPYDHTNKRIKNMEPKIIKSLEAKFNEFGITGYQLVCQLEAGKYDDMCHTNVLARIG